MSLTKEAIEKIGELTKPTEDIKDVDFPAVALSNGYKLESLECFNKYKNQFEGNFRTHILNDFASYVDENNPKDDSLKLFISSEFMTAITYFDMGSVELPGHCLHSARLDLKKTPEYSEYLKITGKHGESLSQEELIEFLIDFPAPIDFFNQDNEPMDFKKALTALRTLSMEKLANKTQTVEHGLSERSALERVELAGRAEIPCYAIFSAAPYDGFSVFGFKTRLKITTKNEIRFSLYRINEGSAEEAMAREFEAKIQEVITGINVYIGAFSVS